MSLEQMLRAARRQHRWNQAELARNLGADVKQQSVSRWERGLVRPSRGMIGRLAATLDLDASALLHAAGYVTPTADGAERVAKPVRPRLVTLPLDQLSAERFEDFCADVLRVLFADTEVHRLGAQGHKQYGVDIIAQRPGGQAAATFQCKRHKQFGPAKVVAAVAAATIKADRHHLLLTRVATSEARLEVAKYADWVMWDVEDISRRVRSELSLDDAIRIVDTYFPRWREDLLGIPEPSPWRTLDEFFGRFSGDKLFNFDQELVGRASQLAEADLFLKNPTQSLAALIGRGGIGKTRLLRSIAEVAEAQGFAVRFLESSPMPSDFEILPTKAPLVIIDDVHNRSDVAEVVSGVHRLRPTAKIIVALRPYRITEMQRELRNAGIHPTELPVWEMSDLAFTEAEAIVRSVLGTGCDEAVVKHLAGISTDCPLLAVIGAGLVKRGQLDPSRLERDPQIRSEIMRSFRDALVPEASGTSPVRRELLNAVAALQPVKTDDPDVRQSLEKLTAAPYDNLVPHLRALEDSGVLLRRGASVRVVPDLLGDVVLVEACYDERSGRSTGYIDRVRAAVPPLLLRHLFVNTSRADWHIRDADSASSALVDGLWDLVDEEFRRADLRERMNLLRFLQKIAFFQPARALKLARWAVENPTARVDPIDGMYLGRYAPTELDLLYETAPVLKHVAYNFELLPDAVDLLWRLAQFDGRPTNQHPDHALRILQELAGIELGKPLEYSERVVDAAVNWLQSTEVWRCSPFDVIDAVLATEGIDHVGDGWTIHLRPFTVRADVVKPLRDRVIATALEEVRSPEPCRAVRAVSSIESSLRGPHGYLSQTIGDEVRASWSPTFVETIGRLGEVASDPQLDPVVAVAVRHAVYWHAMYSADETRQAARETVRRLPNSVEHELALLMFGGWNGSIVESSSTSDISGDAPPGFREYLERYRADADESDDYQAADRRRQARLDEFTETLIGHRSVREIADLVQVRLDAQADALSDHRGQAGPLIWTLVGKGQGIGRELCARAAAGSPALQAMVPIILSQLSETDAEFAITTAGALMSADSVHLHRVVAQAFGWNRGGRGELIPGEWELLTDFARHADAGVRQSAVRAAHIISSTDAPKALQLVAMVRFDDSSEVADDLLGLFGSHGDLKWSDLNDGDRRRLLGQLVICPSLDDHGITEFLRLRSIDAPEEVVRLLLDRIEHSELEGVSHDEFMPLPHRWSLQIQSDADVERLLDLLARWMIERPTSWQRSTFGARIFRHLGLGVGRPVVEFFDRMMRTGSDAEIEVVRCLLRELPASTLWDHSEFVARMLRAANARGDEAVRRIGGAFHAAAVSGVRSGAAGQPFKEDVEQREQALRICRQLPVGSVEARLYQSLADTAEQSISWQIDRDDEMRDGRDW